MPELLARRVWSHQDVLYHFAVHVREPVVAAAVAIRQLRVIEPKLVQDGGVEIVHVDFVLGDGRTDLVGRAVGEAAFHARAGEP